MKVEAKRFEAVGCTHADGDMEVEPNADDICEDCIADGRDDWVHLRVCMTCGHVACCDSSPAQHAKAHFEDTGHAIVHARRDTWAWCYADEVMI